jgi:quercetin 2,3-dioxygenase
VMECGAGNDPADTLAFDRLEGREVHLTTRLVPSDVAPRQGLPVRRYLPTKGRRMVGAWCFLDHFGPDDVADGEGMLVGPHPHTGLQTVTWLLEGEVLHIDSLGSRQPIVPGQLNLMTAGTGISHAEESPPQRPPRLHGLQLWVALPDAARQQQPAFEHHEQLPVLRLPGMTAQVLMGHLAGVSSPATTHTPLVGAVVDVHEGAGTEATAWLPLKRPFEYAVLLLDGEASLDDEPLARDELVYLGHGREGLEVRSAPGARFLLLGGLPFDEEIVIWWNLIGREHDEIVSARALWNAHAPRFGTVRGATGERIQAPPMPTGQLRSRGRT